MNELLNKVSQDEEILWSQIMTSPKEDRISPETAYLFKRLTQAVQLFIYGLLIFMLWQSGRFTSEFLRENLVLVAIILAVIGVIYILKRALKSLPWNMKFERDIFTNAVVTDRRVFLSNHHSDGPQQIEISQNELLSVSRDFENGGQALKFSRRHSAKPAILVGMADLKSAERIINSSLLTHGGDHE